MSTSVCVAFGGNTPQCSQSFPQCSQSYLAFTSLAPGHGSRIWSLQDLRDIPPYTAGSEKVWYTAGKPASLTYLQTLLQADQVFIKGQTHIHHFQVKTYYRILCEACTLPTPLAPHLKDHECRLLALKHLNDDDKDAPVFVTYFNLVWGHWASIIWYHKRYIYARNHVNIHVSIYATTYAHTNASIHMPGQICWDRR